MNVAVVTNILTPYRIPLFMALWKRTDQFAVLLMAQSEENRHWEVPHTPFRTEVLPGFHLRPPGAEVSVHFNYGVIKRLRRLNPDVVLSGGFAVANWLAWLYCMVFGKRYVGWGELTLSDGAASSWLKRTVRQLMTRTSAGSIASSSTAYAAFLHYGARSQSILTTLLPFDVSSLHSHTVRFRASQEGRQLRAHYGGPIVLSIGQLILRKGCRELLTIYQRMVQTRSDVRLLMVGEGPEQQWIEQEIRRNRWSHVHHVGHVQPQSLHTYLAIADVFIFPTLYDSFGLVLSEAMAAELPVVASIHAAAAHDLIQEGITGFLIDPHDPQHAAERVLKVLDLSPEERLRMGRAAYDRVKICDPEEAAAHMMTFFATLAGNPGAGKTNSPSEEGLSV